MIIIKKIGQRNFETKNINAKILRIDEWKGFSLDAKI